MPPERTRPRQDPVSCESCRKKKLKCDRSCPCSNCRTRNLSCVFHGRQYSTGSTSASTTEQELREENALIKSRLQKLESAVFNGQVQLTPSASHSPASNAGVRSTAAALPEISGTQALAFGNENVQALSADSRWLEGSGTSGSLMLPLLSGKPMFATEPLESLVKTSSTNPTYIILPTLSEAEKLYDCYLEQVDTLQHIIHIPTVRTLLQKTYYAIQHGLEVQLSNVSLLLGIFASISTYWALGEPDQAYFSSCDEARIASTHWLRSALDVLDHSWRTEPPNLENVQSCILLVFLIYQLDGFSVRLRILHATAVANARELGLHVTDSEYSKVPEDTQQQIIMAEMRRRIWWHLVSTEWSLSLCGGPHEGVYSILPKHMIVKKPRNISDEDLATQPADFDRPCSESTPTSYYIQRIRLGELCREIADVTWELVANYGPENVPYERITELDARFESLLNSTPDALRVNDNSSLASRIAYQTHPQQAKKKYFNYITLMARRAKLHLPYLIRAGRDVRYSSSRDKCLECARIILNLQHLIPTEQQPQLGGQVRIMGLLQHFFCATIVLCMDLCVNRTMGSETERKSEIQRALQIIEDAGSQSTAAANFVGSLMKILHKHRVRIQRDTLAAESSVPGAGLLYWPRAVYSVDNSAGQDSTFDQDLPSAYLGFDEMWHRYFDIGATAAPQDWDALFYDLDLRFE